MRLSSNSDDETNFPHELLLTNRQVENLRKSFESNSSTDIMLSKTQLSWMIQLAGFLGRLLGPLPRTGLPFIKNVIKLLAKIVLFPLGLTAAASTTGAGIYNKNSNTNILNDEMKSIIKIVKSLDDFSLLLKGVSETFTMKQKNKKEDLLVYYQVH